MYASILRAAMATVTSAAVCLVLAVLARDSWSVVFGPGALRAPDVLLALLTSLALLLALWLLAGLVLSGLARLPGAFGRCFAVLADRVTPAALRRAVAFLLGTSLAAAAAPGTAVAASSPASGRQAVAMAPAFLDARSLAAASPAAAPPVSADTAPDPGFRPTAPRVPAEAPTLDPLNAPPRAPSAAANQYVVRRGDTLWDIAARHLGPRVSASAIAREWPRWYAANRDVIGPDPFLIRPGQALRPPPAREGTP